MIKRTSLPYGALEATHRHFKGDWYRVTGEAHHTETNELLILYVREYPRPSKTTFARPHHDFHGEVLLADGESVKRFEPIEEKT